MMMISKKDLDLLTDEFDKDGDGEITYEEFIEKVMPPEITHGGGGIMDFPCDDPAGKGTMTEQLNKLRKQIKNKISSNSKNMREAFRKMGGAGDGKVDEYEFNTYLRNLGIAAGQPKLVEKLFKEIDDDNSGHITFAEFTAGIEHPKDETHEIKIERHVPMSYLRVPTPQGGIRQIQQQANPQDDPRSEDLRSNAASSIASSIKQRVGKSHEAKQRMSRWQHYPGARGRPVPAVFAKQTAKRTTAAQQRAADLRRSQGRHPIQMTRAASMRPKSAYIASRPSRDKNMKGGSRKRPSSGRRLRTAGSPRAATIQAAAQRASVRWQDSLKKSNYFRSAPAPIHSRKYGAANARARLQAQLQERVNYTSGKGLVSTGDKKLDLKQLLGIK
jgi:Ca2+-binding EF-hand superfamily protein